MQEDFLNSQGWLSLVFEGRNKDYGAYVHREESSDRHLKAMVIITVVALGLIFLPKMIQSVLPVVVNQSIGQIAELNPTLIETQNVDKDPVQIDVPPPPALNLKETTKFTPPLVSADDKVRDEDLILTQQALTESGAAISIATVEGVPGGTVDIATVKDNLALVEESERPFLTAEVMPEFFGGTPALMKWLQDNLIYPVPAQEQNIQGRVVLRFVVKPDGSIDDVQILKSLDPSCDKEAVRVVKKMPKWNPGRQNGNAVAVYYSLPIVFRLQNN